MKKPPSKPFVVEFKNRRRAATAPGRSIWNAIDLRKFDEPTADETPKPPSELISPADQGDAAAAPIADLPTSESPSAPIVEPERHQEDTGMEILGDVETAELTTGSRRRLRRAKADEELRRKRRPGPTFRDGA